MHDHDARGAHFMVRTSPPQAHDFITGTMSHSKQQQHSQQQHHQQYRPSQQHHIQQQSHQGQQQHQQQQQQYSQYQQQQSQQFDHHQQKLQQQQQQQQQQQENFKKYPNDNLYFNYQPLPPFPTPVPASSVANATYSEDDFEDVDEDQISDLDEEEELRLSYEQYRQNLQKQPDVTSQLLRFADMVSADIKKFFGRTKDQEDSCDVYEDKWATTKSGRELYYADLLRIAQGDSEPVSKTTKKSMSSLSSSSSSSLSPHYEQDNRSKFSGRRDVSIGMGPLTELFEYGLRSFLQEDKKLQNLSSRSKSKVTTLTPHVSQKNRFTGEIIPMHERNFPESFWREPSCRSGVGNFNDASRLDISQHNMLTSSKLPDFSDLVESWQGGVEGMTAVGHERGGRMDMPMDHQRL